MSVAHNILVNGWNVLDCVFKIQPISRYIDKFYATNELGVSQYTLVRANNEGKEITTYIYINNDSMNQ